MPPVIAVTLVFVCGIVAQKTLLLPLFFLLFAALLTLIASCLALNERRAFRPLILAAIFVSGMALLSFKQMPPSRFDISYRAGGHEAFLVGVVDDAPVKKDGFTRFILKAESVDRLKAPGKVLCFVSAEGSRALNYGDRVSVRGELSRFDKRKNPGLSTYWDRIEDQDVRAEMFSPNGPLFVFSHGNGNFFRSVCYWLDQRFNEVCSKLLPPPYSDLLGSIVLGSSASPPPDRMKDAYRRVGIIHLLVASGQQISILFGFVLAATRMFGVPKRSGATIASVMGVIFSVVAGAGPSIIRALIMSEMALAADLIGRGGDADSSLSLAALGLLIFDPRLLFDIGFQLSFAATFALLYLAPILEDTLFVKVPRFLSVIISVSVAPFLLTMPIIAYNFSQISIVSVIVNALVIFWIEVLVLTGFVAIIVGSLFGPIAFVFSGVLFMLLKVLNIIVFTFNGLPFASVYIRAPSFPLLLCYYVALAGAIIFMKNKQELKIGASKIIILLLFLSSVLVWNLAVASPAGLTGKLLKITMLDVGQGDSALIECPSGKIVLIDGGDGGAGKNVVVPFLQKKGINRIDMVVLTHPHDDHVGGLNSVLKSFKVDLVLDSAQAHTAPSYIKFLKAIESSKIKYKAGRAGETFDLGEGVKAFVLWPRDAFISGTNSDLNNNSIVLKLAYGKFSMLLPGDLGFDGEKALIKTGADLKSDVIKVGHHGSSTSTSKAFLEKVRPKVAVISVSATNRYGHPSRKSLDRLACFGARIFRTDKNGAVELVSNGSRYLVKPTVK